ncbi:hypothetical protein BDR04DRAFT_595089 [Suillus decipiens]|nr:hypothetical protein BDR04DRAFT_595089 [Suillus decipiens]
MRAPIHSFSNFLGDYGPSSCDAARIRKNLVILTMFFVCPSLPDLSLMLISDPFRCMLYSAPCAMHHVLCNIKRMSTFNICITHLYLTSYKALNFSSCSLLVKHLHTLPYFHPVMAYCHQTHIRLLSYLVSPTVHCRGCHINLNSQMVRMTI